MTGRHEQGRVLVAAGTLAVRTEPFGVDSLMRLAAALPDERLVDQALLSEYDSYHGPRAYAARGQSHGQAPGRGARL